MTGEAPASSLRLKVRQFIWTGLVHGESRGNFYCIATLLSIRALFQLLFCLLPHPRVRVITHLYLIMFLVQLLTRRTAPKSFMFYMNSRPCQVCRLWFHDRLKILHMRYCMCIEGVTFAGLLAILLPMQRERAPWSYDFGSDEVQHWLFTTVELSVSPSYWTKVANSLWIS